MKGEYILELKPFQCSIFTSVKHNKDCIKLLLETVRILQVYGNNLLPSPPSKGAYIKVCKNKINRLFVFLDSNKFVSIQFPFDIIKVSDQLNFKFKGIDIDSKLISEGLGLLAQLDDDKYHDIRYILNSEDDEINQNTYNVLGSLALLDFGYLRFDHDPKNEKGDIHPLNHLDVNYSKNGTFKIKLASKLSIQNFEDVFDKDKPCVSMFIDFYNKKSNNIGRKNRRKRKK